MSDMIIVFITDPELIDEIKKDCEINSIKPDESVRRTLRRLSDLHLTRSQLEPTIEQQLEGEEAQ